MDKGLSSDKIPEAPKTKPLGFQGGVIQGFPTSKGATKNQVCSHCGCYCDDKGKCNPCGGKKGN